MRLNLRLVMLDGATFPAATIGYTVAVTAARATIGLIHISLDEPVATEYDQLFVSHGVVFPATN